MIKYIATRVIYLFAIKNNFGVLGVIKYVLLNIYSKYKKRDRSFCREISAAQRALFDEIGVSKDKARQLANKIVRTLNLREGEVLVDRLHILAFAALREAGFRPANILELGTSTGNATAFLSETFPDATIFTFELPADDPLFSSVYHSSGDEEYSKLVHAKLKHRSNIRTFRENTFNIMKYDLPDFDLIWLDAGHEYPEIAWDHFYCIHKLSPGGWIFSDDVLLPRNFLCRHNARHFHVTQVIEYINERMPQKFKFFPKRCEPDQFIIFGKYVAVLHKPSAA